MSGLAVAYQTFPKKPLMWLFKPKELHRKGDVIGDDNTKYKIIHVIKLGSFGDLVTYRLDMVLWKSDKEKQTETVAMLKSKGFTFAGGDKNESN